MSDDKLPTVKAPKADRKRANYRRKWQKHHAHLRAKDEKRLRQTARSEWAAHDPAQRER